MSAACRRIRGLSKMPTTFSRMTAAPRSPQRSALSRAAGHVRCAAGDGARSPRPAAARELELTFISPPVEEIAARRADPLLIEQDLDVRPEKSPRRWNCHA